MEEKVRRTPAKLSKFVEDLHFNVLNKGTDYNDCLLTISDANRPALQLVGFYDFFDPKRLQVLGLAEMKYLERMSVEERQRTIGKLMSYKFPAIIISRGMEAFPEILEAAEKHGRTVLSTSLETVVATSHIVDYLNHALAPQVTRHGVLMNIYGQGVLLLGDSGIGKSETAIELLKRGHRLVSDDAVDIKCISNGLYGSAPELIQHYIEVRGVGIIDVKELFGLSAVQYESSIDLVIKLEIWDDHKVYDRLGLSNEVYTLMDVSVPFITIPVSAGRNVAAIVEIATMNERQKRSGFNPTEDFITKIDKSVDAMMQKV